MQFNRVAYFLALFLAVFIPARAQKLKLPVDFDKLAAKAKQSVDVTLDSSMLQLGSKFLSSKDANEANVKKLVSGLKAIYVRSFEFDKPGQYPESDVEALRSQFTAPTWSRVVGVRSKADGENADIFFKKENGRIMGMVIIAAEPKELTFVHIDGLIDPEQIGELSGHFGIPKLEKKKTGEK